MTPHFRKKQNIKSSWILRRRYANDPAFREKQKAEVSQWVKDHRPEVRRRAAIWRAANRDKIKGYNRKWRDNNKEKERESYRLRYAKNPENGSSRSVAILRKTPTDIGPYRY